MKLRVLTTLPVSDPYIKNTTLLLKAPGANAADNKTFKDTSPNRFAVTRNGGGPGMSQGTFSPFSQRGWSTYVPAASTVVFGATASAALNFGTGNFTVECWFNPDSTSTAEVSLFMEQSSTVYFALNHDQTNQRFALYLNLSTATTQSATTTVGNWYHVVLCRTGTTLSLFLNGARIYSATNSGTMGYTNPSPTRIGAGAGVEAAYVSNLRVTNTAVYDATQSLLVVPTAPLTAVPGTQLLTAQSNRFKDNSPNNFAITLTGTPSIHPVCLFTPQSTTATTDGWSGFFSGAGSDYIVSTSTTALPALSTSDFSVECWVYPTSALTASQNKIVDGGFSSSKGANITVTSTSIFGEIGTSAVVSVGYSLLVNTWYHIVWCRTGSTCSVFVNGVQKGTATSTAGSTASQLSIGGTSTGTALFAGYISNVRYCQTVSAYPASALTLAVPTSPLTAIPGTQVLTCQSNRFIDNSPNNFALTVNGTTSVRSFSPPTTRESRTFDATTGDYSAYFDGASQITFPTGAATQFGTGDFTVECWAYPTTNNAANHPLFDTRTSSDNTGAMFGLNSTTTPFMADLAGGILNGSATIATNTWYHVAFVRRAGTSTIYWNGVSAGSGADTVNHSDGGISIGKDMVGAFFSGYISNLRVGNTAVYSAAFTPSNGPLIAIPGTQLLTCQSSTLKDNSPNNLAGTLVGGATIETFSPFPQNYTFGAATTGGSGYFDGTADYIQTSAQTAPDVGAGDFTVECWVYPTATGQANASQIIGKRTLASSFAPWSIGVASGTYTLNLWLSTTGTTWDKASAVASGTMIPNAWNHVALVRSTTTAYMYLNGVVSSTTTGLSTTALMSASSSVTVGSGGTASTYFTGYISDARVIVGTCLYPAGTTFTPPTAPLNVVANTQLLLNFNNSAIADAVGGNNIETVGSAQASTAVVKYGPQSMKFNGTTDTVNTNVNTAVFDLSTSDWTVEYWANPTSFSTGNNVHVYIGNSAGDKLVIATIGTPGALDYLLNATVVIAAGSVLTAGVWAHIALVKSGATTTLYVNGVSKGTTASVPTSSAKSLVVGADAGGAPFAGYIEDLRITKGVARYVSKFTPPSAPLPTQ